MDFDPPCRPEHRRGHPWQPASDPDESPTEPVGLSSLRGCRRLLRRPFQHRDEDSVVVRCPLCRQPLSVRLGPAGPYFHCRCRQGRPR
jgi:hypothetical protein